MIGMDGIKNIFWAHESHMKAASRVYDGGVPVDPSTVSCCSRIVPLWIPVQSHAAPTSRWCHCGPQYSLMLLPHAVTSLTQTDPIYK